MDIPTHPLIRHLGFLDDADKFDVIAGAAALVMPSYYESLSMAALEAWALGRPVIANARCDVLLGQCLRSNAGLYYANADEFGAVLETVLDAGQYDVVFVESTEHAYSHIKQLTPHLIIVCLDIDDLDGFQVLSMLKLDAATKDIPLVTCTSSQDDEETPDELLDPQEGVFSQPAAMQLN